MYDEISLRSARTRRILQWRWIDVDGEVRQRARVECILTGSAGVDRETIKVDVGFVDEIPGVEGIRNGHATRRAGDRRPVSNVDGGCDVVAPSADIEDPADAAL